jgi:tetratricopeptide (TPR) repeat protein
MAWCNYKMGQTKQGLEYLEQVIYEGRKSKGQSDGTTGGVSRIRLATEAIKDVIIFFAEVGDYNNARAYFEEVVGERSANANLARLAYFYSDTGNRPAARHIFKDLIDQDPNTIKAYDYQYAIVKMYGAAGSNQDFKDELYSWIEQYGPGSNWQKINAKDKEAIAKANELMESLLRNQVLMQHKVAQNSRTKSAQAAARSGYDTYFETFKNSPKSEEMHFFYGELLFDIGEYEKAAQNYTWVVENASTGQYHDKALLNSLLSYEKRLPSDTQIKKIVGEATIPIDFTPEIVAFEKAAYRYLQKTKSGESAIAVQYRLGALYYLFNRFELAIPILTEIIKNHPRTPYAKFAANHLLDIYNIRGDYDGLLKAANDILAIPALAKSDVGRQIQDIKLKTDFKLAKENEDNKDYAKAAKAYEDFAMKNRTSSLATAALFNSAVNYEKAGSISQAIPMYVLVANNKAKGGEELAKKSKRFLPVLYEKIGQYAKAAQHFESYALANPDERLSVEYHYNAAVIYDGLNSFNSAIRNYDFYQKKQKGKDRFESLFLIAKIFERTGQKQKSIYNYKQYLTTGTTNVAAIIEAHYNIAKMYDSMGNKKEAETWYKKTIGVHRRLSTGAKKVGASNAAEAKFKLVYNTYEELVALRIPADPAKQGGVVKKKLAIINRLKDELKQVIAYDDAEQIIASLTTQGMAQQHMYASMLNSPPPRGLKPEELKMYRAELQKVADPFKEQAVELYNTAVSRGHELQGYNAHLLLALRNLNILSGKTDAAFDAKVFITKMVDGMEK